MCNLFENSVFRSVIFINCITSVIRNCEFRDIYATNSNGGAISIQSSCKNVFVSICTFTNCLATLEGGAIYSDSYNLTLSRLCFSNCSIVSSSQYGIATRTTHNGYYIMNYVSSSDCPSYSAPKLHCCFLPKSGNQNTLNTNVSRNSVSWNSGSHHWEFASSTIKFYLVLNSHCGEAVGVSCAYQRPQDHSHCMIVNNTVSNGCIWCLNCHVYFSDSVFLRCNRNIGHLTNAQLTVSNSFIDSSIPTNGIIAQNIVQTHEFFTPSFTIHVLPCVNGITYGYIPKPQIPFTLLYIIIG